MSQTFALKQHDTGPALLVKLKGADGAPQDLTGATVRFTMHARGATAPAIDGALATVTNPTGGVVSYSWQAADTAKAGVFRAEFSATLANNTVVTFPGDDYLVITILPDL